MPKSAREVPKEIALFGERQFNETGAISVEVLRVKAATIRKHFRELRGVTFLVAVISLDRVRVYLFTNAGVMTIGENLTPSTYAKIRKSSRLLAKFKKPRELTPEEKRIEATDELRAAFGKALRRVSRYLGIKEPLFPNLYVVHELGVQTPQSFGTEFSNQGEVVFEEAALNKKWTESILNRTAFVVSLPITRHSSEFCSLVGNALSLSILKQSQRAEWVSGWREQSKKTEWLPLVEHFVKHADTYRSNHYSWLWTLLTGMTNEIGIERFTQALRVIHDGCTVPIGTEEYSEISGYCKACKSPRNLLKSRYSLPSIHLSPRILALPENLGTSVTLGDAPNKGSMWASVSFMTRNEIRFLVIHENGEESIDRLEYRLDLEDCYPSTGGLISHGRSVVHRALATLGLKQSPSVTFEATVERSGSTLNTREHAVLKRLLLGDAGIITNSLIGSPNAVESLVKKGRIVIVPDFNHIGLNPNFLIHGRHDAVKWVTETNSVESMILTLGDKAYALVSAPSTWRSGLTRAATDEKLSIWPVRDVSSPRRMIRDEKLFD